MERYFSTGQSPQRAVAPTGEEEELYLYLPLDYNRACNRFTLFFTYRVCILYISYFARLLKSAENVERKGKTRMWKHKKGAMQNSVSFFDLF
jgi:hypothetical protein